MDNSINQDEKNREIFNRNLRNIYIEGEKRYD